MTPPCCDRAWAKATGRGPLFIHGGAWAVRNEEPYGADGPVSWVPKPTSAEWLADCINGFLLTGWNVELGIFLGTPFAMLRKRLTDPQEVRKGTGWDEFSALCAALNGSPCERKAA